MKKSEAYQIAQIAVVNSPMISPEGKVEIIKYLIEDEELAVFCEKQMSEKNGEMDK